MQQLENIATEIATEEAPVTVLTILETLQTFLGVVKDQLGTDSLDKVITEMELYAEMDIEGSAAQCEIVKAVLASDHVQAGW
jgi:hypothetical protein